LNIYWSIQLLEADPISKKVNKFLNSEFPRSHESKFKELVYNIIRVVCAKDIKSSNYIKYV
jgi:hypothetical protein